MPVWFGVSAVIVLLGYALTLHAQDVTLSITAGPVMAGGKATAAISLVSSGPVKPAALQWTLNSSAGMTDIAFGSSSGAVAAGKSIRCSSSVNSSVCLLYGLNGTALSDGAVATVTFDLPSTVPGNSISLEINNVVASTGDGQPISSEGRGTTVQVISQTSVKGLSAR